MDIIKNFIYAGVGLATTTTNKAKDAINDLVEKGKISDTEGKRIMEDFFKATENTKEEFETRWKKLNENLSSKLDFSSNKTSKEVNVLKSRIEELEKKLNEANAKLNTKKVVKKSTTTRKTKAKKTEQK